MIALSFRPRYAELILHGVKTIEYRSRPMRKIGERVAVYQNSRWAGVAGHDMAGIGAGEETTVSAQPLAPREPAFPTARCLVPCA